MLQQVCVRGHWRPARARKPHSPIIISSSRHGCQSRTAHTLTKSSSPFPVDAQIVENVHGGRCTRTRTSTWSRWSNPRGRDGSCCRWPRDRCVQSRSDQTWTPRTVQIRGSCPNYCSISIFIHCFTFAFLRTANHWCCVKQITRAVSTTVLWEQPYKWTCASENFTSNRYDTQYRNGNGSLATDLE